MAFVPNNQYFDQAAGAAMPDRTEFDNAAARIRSRLSGAAQGQQMQLRDQFAGAGRMNSGAYRQGNRQIGNQFMSTYGGELSGLESEWMKRRQEGANTLNSIGQNYNQAGIQADQNRITEQVGMGNIAQQRYATDQEANSNRTRNLVDFLQAYGTFGNTQPLTSDPRYNQYMGGLDQILSQLLGAF